MRIKLEAVQCKTKTVEERFKEFVRYCKVKNLSDRTLDFYQECFERFCKSYSKDGLLWDISQRTIEGYILYLKANTSFNSVSINTSLRGIRAFLYYQMKAGYIQEFKIQLLNQEKKIKETYTQEELKLLLKKPDIKRCTFAEYRD